MDAISATGLCRIDAACWKTQSATPTMDWLEVKVRHEWGVSRRLVAALRERCTILSTSVCHEAERSRGIVWLEPTAIVEVQYNEMMQGRLRDAVLRSVHPRS